MDDEQMTSEMILPYPSGRVEWRARSKSKLSYFIGLDLGQAQDYTALAVLERHGIAKDATFHCRHLKRWPLGTPYPAIVTEVARLAGSNELRREEGRPKLAVDATGVGAPVVDLFRGAKMNARLEAVLITGGDSVSRDGRVTRVPKRFLVSAVQVALQTARLRIAATLPDAQSLVRELQGFQVKISDTAHDTYGTWREGAHDDLVLAVALALWSGESEREWLLL